MMFTCKVCGFNTSSTKYTVREMMFGIRESFAYSECDACKSIQIDSLLSPDDLLRFYPNNYYSFAPRITERDQLTSHLYSWLSKQRDDAAIGHFNLIGKALGLLKPAPAVLKIIVCAGARTEDRILDVGCGAQGHLLDRLASVGFTRLRGVDPFIASNVQTKMGIEISKAHLNSVSGIYDFIMFNHSLEHVLYPEEELRAARQRLRRGGCCLVRIPTPSSEARQIYGVHWVHFDAPRHQTLVSRTGMTILASKCGFVLESVIDDATAFGFVASELYLRDVPLIHQRAAEMFSPRQLAQFNAQVQRLNQRHRGDQAAFVLRALS